VLVEGNVVCEFAVGSVAFGVVVVVVAVVVVIVDVVIVVVVVVVSMFVFGVCVVAVGGPIQGQPWEFGS
jgi:hypothetical protein